MVLCIFKINGMLKMQSASFTATVLDMRNAAYGSNGGGYIFIYIVFLLFIRDALSLCFLLVKKSLLLCGFQGEVSSRHDDGSYQKPTKTLFVCNFDPFKTKEIDIEEHFKPYGKVVNVRIRSSYSFVQFATQEDATKALEATQRRSIATQPPDTFFYPNI